MPGMILVGIMSVVMVVFPPKGTTPELKAEEKKEPRGTVVQFVVPDDPQSHRYQIGEIDWKTVEEVTRDGR